MSLSVRRGLGGLCRLRAVLSRVSGVGALHNRLPLRIRSLRSRLRNLSAHVRGVGTRVRRLGASITAHHIGVRADGTTVTGCARRLSGMHGGHRCRSLDGRVRCRALSIRLGRGHVHRTRRGVRRGGRRVAHYARRVGSHHTSLSIGGSRLSRVVSRAETRRRGLHRETGSLRDDVRTHLLLTFGHVHGGDHGNLNIICMRHSTYNNYFGGVPPRHRLSVHVHGGVVMYRCYNHVVVSPRLTNMRSTGPIRRGPGHHHHATTTSARRDGWGGLM